jgi:hypothetical protein
VRIPVWLTLAVAALVIIFGLYRIRIALTRSDEAEAKARSRRGLYAMSKRAHLFIGVIYLLLGAGLIATSFGWNPFGGSIGRDPDAPAKDQAPTPGSAASDRPAHL